MNGPRTAAFVALGLLLGLAGCGLKGALYLPEKPGEVTIRPGRPAPATTTPAPGTSSEDESPRDTPAGEPGTTDPGERAVPPPEPGTAEATPLSDVDRAGSRHAGSVE